MLRVTSFFSFLSFLGLMLIIEISLDYLIESSTSTRVELAPQDLVLSLCIDLVSIRLHVLIKMRDISF